MSEMTVKIALDSMSTYYKVEEDLKVFGRSACLITYAKPVAWKRPEIGKREVSAESNDPREAEDCR